MFRRESPANIRAIAAACVACWALGCSSDAEVSSVDLAPADGVVVITLDTLRADRLSGLGYAQPTSPHLDAFADESVVFEHAIAQYPSTLASHMSIFTGLYPRQHGVVERDRSLSPQIPILAEVFRQAGFRTAGYTENGMISPGSGLGRGFEEFVFEHIGPPTGPDRIFELGLEFLNRLDDDERPFLWLHTYAVHTPYEPTDGNRERFLRGHPEPQVPVTGEYLTQVNRGLARAADADVEAMSRLYNGQLRDVDAAFRRFLDSLEARGWGERLAIAVFADHGEEFRDHGHLAHEQVYPELIHVPLMIYHPRLEPRRVGTLVEIMALAPTLADLAGIEWPSSESAQSLVRLASGIDDGVEEKAYAETEIGLHQRSVIQRFDGDLWQLIEHRFPVGEDGVWFSTASAFDVQGGRDVELELMAYRRPRSARVSVNGQATTAVDISTGWHRLRLQLPPDCHLCRVAIEVDSCERPVDVGESKDQRCLAVKVKGGERRRYELYNLSEDPGAEHDLVREREPVFRRLFKTLQAMPSEPVHAPGAAGGQQDEDTLRTLGYLG